MSAAIAKKCVRLFHSISLKPDKATGTIASLFPGLRESESIMKHKWICWQDEDMKAEGTSQWGNWRCPTPFLAK
jgi:hypothetical protein